MVLNVHAVLETSDTTDFPLWPVADLPPWRFMALSGRMSPLEVGTALATLADYNSRAGDDDRPVTDAGEAIRRLLRVDRVVAPGGLRVHDTRTDVTVTPGCCCGLEDWRAWLDVADGDSPGSVTTPHHGLSMQTGSSGCGPTGETRKKLLPGIPSRSWWVICRRSCIACRRG